VSALAVTAKNPPVDITKTREFNAHRIGGVPAFLRAHSVARDRNSVRFAENLTTGAPGQTGLNINPSGAGTYYGLYAGHSGWEESEFGYSQPAQLLYAPTGRPPNSCIEVGTAYRPGSSTPPEVFAYDFCNPNAPWSDPPMNTMKIGSYSQVLVIDDSFRTAFERDFGDGVPQYSMEIVQNPSGVWTLYLYNWTAGLWLPYYTSRGTSFNNGFEQPTQGWDIFEPKYPSGVCISTPQIEAGGMQLYNRFSGQWVTMANVSDAALGSSRNGDCIGYDDGSGIGAYYEFFPQSDKTNWSVYSFQSLSPPSGGGGTPSCNPLRDCCYSIDVESCCEPFSSCCGFGGCCPPDDSACCPVISFNGDTCGLSSKRRPSTISRHAAAFERSLPTGKLLTPVGRSPDR
jgi:hypothetical protein